MSDAWDRLVPKLAELRDLRSASALLHWDQAVMMPPRGAEARASAIATIEGFAHARLTAPEVGELIEELAGTDSLDQEEAASVRILKRRYDKAVRVPGNLVRAIAQAQAAAYHAWTEARPSHDFRSFAPHLERIVALKKEQADAVGYDKERYDALLDDYEPGMTTSKVEALFEDLVKGLKPVVDSVLGSIGPPPKWLEPQPFEPDVQMSVSHWLVAQLGFDPDAGRLDTSPHPFTTRIGAGDVRQTTRPHPRSLLPCLYAAVHETGHALYEQGIPKELLGLPVGEVPSMGMHESQSRMWENLVARSRDFTDWLLPHLKERFPSELGMVSPEDFYLGVNYPHRSLIRIHADELTYNLHIAVRLELEVALFRDALAPGDVEDAWDDAMERHLGIRPENAGEGALQDVHWALGLQGYFTTYTLGNLYAAAFYARARAELGDLGEEIRSGDTTRLLDWLRDNIHSRAYRYETQDLYRRVTGSDMSVTPLLDHLDAKYRALA